MSDKVDLSIIIPVYNTPVELLQRCFDSIQIDKKISMEVLIIDDGSAPIIGSFCKAYQKRKEQFRYFYMENMGVSAARNLGIKNATGRYIMFVDSDDVIEGKVIQQQWLTLNADIIFFNILWENNGVGNNVKIFREDSGNLEKKKVLEAVFFSNHLNESFAKLIKREIIITNNIHFETSMVVAEDALFITKVIMLAETMYYCDETAYIYYYSYDNGKNRLSCKFDEIISSLLYFYCIRRKILEEYAQIFNNLDIDLQKCYCEIEVWIVENLFNNIATFIVMRGLKEFKKTMANDKITKLRVENFKNFPCKSKAKYMFLRLKMYYTISMIAYIREKYAKKFLYGNY